MQIELERERRDQIKVRLQHLFLDRFDEDLSDFQAGEVTDFFVKMLGPTVYNQAVQDVRAHMQTRLDDLEGEIYIAPEI